MDTISSRPRKYIVKDGTYSDIIMDNGDKITYTIKNGTLEGFFKIVHFNGEIETGHFKENDLSGQFKKINTLGQITTAITYYGTGLAEHVIYKKKCKCGCI